MGNELLLSNAGLAELLQATLAKGIPFRFEVKGFSMSPFIKDGDVVTLSAAPGAIGLGRPAAFIRPKTGRMVIHRIIGRNGDHYLMKGDNAAEPDSFVLRKNILGLVTKVERRNKRVRMGLGPERFIISFLSQRGLLGLVFWAWRIMPLRLKRSIS